MNSIPQNATSQQHIQLNTRFRNLIASLGKKYLKNVFHKPVFIISAPRSGSTLLFESLVNHSEFWTLGQECHTIYRAIPALDPSVKNFDSGILSKDQADPDTCDMVRAGFSMFLRDHNGRRLMQIPPASLPASLRFLEKTPRNSLNIPFLNKIFPDASYIFLTRDAETNINSIIEAWHVGLKDGSFITFNDLEGWDRKDWCMLLPPGWRELNGRSVAEISAFQWKSCNDIIMDDLKSIPKIRKIYTRYEDLIQDPRNEISRLLKFCKMSPDLQLPDVLPLSKTTVSKPDPDKWKKRIHEINPILPGMSATRKKLEELHKNQFHK